MICAALAGCESEPAGQPIVLRPPPARVVSHHAARPAPKPAERPAQAASQPQGQTQGQAQAQRQAASPSQDTCSVEIERARICAAQQQQQMTDTEKEELFRRFDSYLANQRERP